MSCKIYDLQDLLENEDFCDYIQSWADRTGREYSEIYDEVLDSPLFADLVVDGWLSSDIKV